MSVIPKFEVLPVRAEVKYKDLSDTARQGLNAVIIQAERELGDNPANFEVGSHLREGFQRSFIPEMCGQELACEAEVLHVDTEGLQDSFGADISLSCRGRTFDTVDEAKVDDESRAENCRNCLAGVRTAITEWLESVPEASIAAEQELKEAQAVVMAKEAAHVASLRPPLSRPC